jgi:hypothetical protein
LFSSSCQYKCWSHWIHSRTFKMLISQKCFDFVETAKLLFIDIDFYDRSGFNIYRLTFHEKVKCWMANSHFLTIIH